MMLFHERGLIHADIKKDNVLIKETGTGNLTARIIDFDSGFQENDVPSDPGSLCCDQVYMAPEAFLFMVEEEKALSCRMDVFSMGLLFHQYLTGELPRFDRDEYDYAFEAVLDGKDLVIDSALDEMLRNMLSLMLKRDPAQRISSREVFRILSDALGVSDAPEPEPDPAGNSRPAGNSTSAGYSRPAGGFLRMGGDL